MPDRDLSALIERVEQLSGPVDSRTAMELADMAPWERFSSEWHLLTIALDSGLDAVGAVLALMELVLPGWSFDLRTEGHHENGFRAELWPSWGPTAYRRVEALARPTPALAILLALLRALRSRETADG